MTQTTTFTIYIRNLHTYTDHRITLPMDEHELDRVMYDISEQGQHDCIIVDCWGNNGIKINELDDIQNINKIAQATQELDRYGIAALGFWLADGYDIDDAIEMATNNEYSVYTDCFDMAAVAEQYADETELLNEIPEHLRGYFDYAALGRDLEIDGDFRYLGAGEYIELHR